MGGAIFTFFIGFVIQAIYIYALGEIKAGTNTLITETETPKPYRTIHNGVSILYTMAWIGLVLSVFAMCIALTAANNISAGSSGEYMEINGQRVPVR